MTATSVLSTGAVKRSWSAAQRAAVMLFVIVVFAAGAFAIGRTTAPSGHGSPVIAPAVTPAAVTGIGGETVGRCRSLRPC